MMQTIEQTGVYAIRHVASGKRYIGSAAVSFRSRWNTHRSSLGRGVHHSRYLQAAWNKYGQGAFVFEVVEKCCPAFAVDVEQVMIDFYRSATRGNGYNIAPKAMSCLGIVHTEETRRRMSVAMTGLKRSPEACERMKGRKPSAETIEKIASKNRGRKASQESRAKMSATRIGRTASETTRHKMSNSMRGLKRSPEFCLGLSLRHKGKVISDTHRLAISVASKGRKKSDETRKRMSLAQVGRVYKPHTDEARAKMSAAGKGRVKSEAHLAAIRLGHQRTKLRRASALLAILPPFAL